MTQFDAEDSGKQVTLAVGDTFTVRLPGAEAPGYGWTLTPGDRSVVDTADGSTFVARSPGATRLVFAYHHPHENRAPIKTVVLDVTVNRWSGWWTLFGVGAAVVAATGGITYAIKRRSTKR